MNEGNNKGRIIFYTILFFLSLGFSIYGYILYTDGYGKNGEIRMQLLPIVDNFNNLKYVKNSNGDIKAKYSGKKIVIKYKEKRTSKSFSAMYTEVASMKLLEFKYDIADTSTAEISGKLLLDAVSINNRNIEGDLFDLIAYSDLYNTNTKQGASLAQKGPTITLMININANLVENIKDTNISKGKIEYITQNEILTTLNENTLLNLLNEKGKYNYYKNDIVLNIFKSDNKYEIYCYNSEDNKYNMFESIMSVVKLISKNAYDNIIKNNPDYNKNIDTNEFSLENYKDNETNKYTMKLTLKKI